MSAGKQANEHSIDYVLLADDYLAYLAANLIQVAGCKLECRIRTHHIILSAESSGSLAGVAGELSAPEQNGSVGRSGWTLFWFGDRCSLLTTS